MLVKNAPAGIAVADFQAALGWYETLLDRPPNARPMQAMAEWEFGTGGWIQLFQDRRRAGSACVTFVEDNLDARLQDLRDKHIRVDATSGSAAVRTAVVNDPDGNRIVFAQWGGRMPEGSS